MNKINIIYNLKTISIVTSAAGAAFIGAAQILQAGHLKTSAPEIERAMKFPPQIGDLLRDDEHGSTARISLFRPFLKPRTSGVRASQKCTGLEIYAFYKREGSMQDRMSVKIDCYSQPGYALAAQKSFESTAQTPGLLRSGSYTGAELGATTSHFGAPGAREDSDLWLISANVRISIDSMNLEDTPSGFVSHHTFTRADAIAIEQFAKVAMVKAKTIAKKM